MIKNTKIVVYHDPTYKSQSEVEKKLSILFSNLNKLSKGIKFQEDKDALVLNIDNKYYNCYLQFEICSIYKNENTQTEGIIFYWTSNNLSYDKLQSILNSNSNKPNFIVIVFEEERGFMSSLSGYEDFIGFAIDNNIEVITSINTTDDEEEGVQALNMSLQSCHWSNSELKNNKVAENNKIEEIIPDKNSYQQLQDEHDFDQFLENINNVRRMNMNDAVTDEERRANAENAIMMLAKFLKLEDDGDFEQVEEDEN